LHLRIALLVACSAVTRVSGVAKLALHSRSALVTRLLDLISWASLVDRIAVVRQVAHVVRCDGATQHVRSGHFIRGTPHIGTVAHLLDVTIVRFGPTESAALFHVCLAGLGGKVAGIAKVAHTQSGCVAARGTVRLADVGRAGLEYTVAHLGSVACTIGTTTGRVRKSNSGDTHAGGVACVVDVTKISGIGGIADGISGLEQAATGTASPLGATLVGRRVALFTGVDRAVTAEACGTRATGRHTLAVRACAFAGTTRLRAGTGARSMHAYIANTGHRVAAAVSGAAIHATCKPDVRNKQTRDQNHVVSHHDVSCK